MRNLSRAALLSALLLAACDTPLEFEPHWLDGPEVFDPSLNSPGYRLSTRPGMTPADLDRPVIIAVHGFTASTFEWQEFREHAENGSDVLVSLVLLGGHGRTGEEFAASTWKEWGAPMVAEYEALVAQGYTRISVATASTAGALVLEQIAAGEYRGAVRPRHFFLVDPIVVPTDKKLTLIPLLRHLISGVQVDGTEEERAHWYSNRPAAALAELYDLITRVRGRLAGGIRLPEGAQATVYKTSRDPTADPVSALLIYRGLRTSVGERVEVQMFDSPLHVFTRLAARPAGAVAPGDVQRQLQVFEEMIARASQ
jgi:carboxylesterase